MPSHSSFSYHAGFVLPFLNAILYYVVLCCEHDMAFGHFCIVAFVAIILWCISLPLLDIPFLNFYSVL